MWNNNCQVEHQQTQGYNPKIHQNFGYKFTKQILGKSLKMTMPSKQKARKRCAKKWQRQIIGKWVQVLCEFQAQHIFRNLTWPNQLDRHPRLSQSLTCVQHCHNQLENLIVPGSSDRNYHQGHQQSLPILVGYLHWLIPHWFQGYCWV